MSRCAIISFRLRLTDGVSIVARHWEQILGGFGFEVFTVAAEGPVDVEVPGLAIGATEPAGVSELDAALADADLVIVENLLSIPLNLGASRALATALAGRPALLHHHDPPWQRERFAHIDELPPTDDAWRHVTINELTRLQMADRGIEATRIYNGFDTEATIGDRAATRALLDVADDELLVGHPVRAIERKGIGAAIELCERLGATYWLLGQAEEDYGPTLDRLLAEAKCRVIHRPVSPAADIYAAPDLIAFPSLWEGFGNPPVEAAIFGRPAAVSDYPVAQELRELGFEWFLPSDIDAIRAELAAPDLDRRARNRRLAHEHFGTDAIASQLRALLADAGWLP